MVIYMNQLTKKSYLSNFKSNGKEIGIQYIDSRLKLINYGKIIELSDKKLDLTKVVVDGVDLSVIELDKNYLLVRGSVNCITLKN